MSVKPKPEIHPTAVVAREALIAEGVRIGPYTVIGPEVEVREGTEIGPHAVIEGPTRVGRNNRIFGQCAIGTIPQDLKFHGERSQLVIGNGNTIREFVTIHRGTEGGGGRTVIGDGNLLMTGVHVAHDCEIGSGTILANAATLAGHVLVCDHAIVGAFTGVHQFCRVGAHAFVGGYSVLTRDGLPFIRTVGSRNQARIYGINSLGLRRQGFSAERIRRLKGAYRWLFQKGLRLQEAVERIRGTELESPDVELLIEFIEGAKRGFVRERGEPHREDSEAGTDRG